VRFTAGRRNQFYRPAIEAGEEGATEPAAFKGDDAIGKVPTGRHHREAGIDGRPIRAHPRAVDQMPDCPDNLAHLPSVPPREYPDEFAKRCERDGHNFCIPQRFRS